MLCVDIHAHHVPVAVLDELRRAPGRLQGVEMLESDDGDIRLSFTGIPLSSAIRDDLMDLDGHRNWMAKQGINHMLLSTWLDLTAYSLPSRTGERWSRLLNEKLLEVVKTDPARFSALATVPLQDGIAAARVLRSAADLGHRGVMIGTWIAGKELDDPDLDPFWIAATERGVPVLLHPPFPLCDSRLTKYGLSNVFGRAWETVLGALHLFCGGVLNRFPELKVVFLHGGGFLPYQIGRFDRHIANNPSMIKSMGMQPSELLKRCHFDHIVFHPLALQFLIDLVGTQHIMIGSDYPFEMGDQQPLQVLGKSNLEEHAQKAICANNAVRLFDLLHVTLS